MGQTMKRKWVFLILAAIVCSLTFIHVGEAIAQESLKVGVLLPLTGDAAAWGSRGQKGIQIAVDDLNTSNACGRPVTALFEDSAANDSTGLSAFHKLVSANGVPVVIGDLVSSVTLAIAPAAERSKVVVLSPTASAPNITDAGTYIYRIASSDLVEGRVIAEYAVQHGYKRAAILYINNDYGLGIKTVFDTGFTTQQRKVLFSEAYLPTNQDFRSALSKMRGLNVDVLYVAGYYADSATIVRQARELGLKIPILGTTAIEEQKFLDLAGSAAEGLVYPLSTGYDVASSDPQVRKFVESFQRRFNDIPSWIEAHAYDAMAVICKASQAITGNPTGAALKTGLDNIGTFKGVAGEIKFDQNGDVVRPVRLRTVRGGKFVNLGQ